MRYLLDTNIVSDLIRHPDGKVARHIRRVGEMQVCTSIIVAAEMRYGAAKKQSPRLIAEVEGLLSRLTVLAWEAPADVVYGEIRTRLERIGRPIGANDLLIAAHTLARDYVLVSDNEKEFAAIPNLRRENWLRRP
jgi:tRNA(fMet)-specific endonuclease VapC